jgi:hypothetical protein
MELVGKDEDPQAGSVLVYELSRNGPAEKA